MKVAKLGYSPCPNDTFIMAGLAEGRVGSEVDLEHVLADVETLNQWAVQQRLEFTKISFMALGKVRDAYGLLYSGSAIGWGCGPLVVARPGWTIDRLEEGRIAAPGSLTTARLLLSLFHGREPRFMQMVFSEVMPAVAEGEAEFGLVIHEGRFTYEGYGLKGLLDLGAWWECETGLPIPLGGIAVRRDMDPDCARSVDRAIRSSLEEALRAPDSGTAYVQKHAQEMDPDVTRQHIELYVNQFSLGFSGEGQKAVSVLFSRAEAAGLMPSSSMPLMAYDR